MSIQKKNSIVGRGSARKASGTEHASSTAAILNSETVPWTFLTNHAHVLIILHSEPDLVLREVASRVGITERAVQRIVQELEEAGYLRRERVGRCNHYQILSGKRLRHPVESHCTIDQVLELVSGISTPTKQRPKK